MSRFHHTGPRHKARRPHAIIVSAALSAGLLATTLGVAPPTLRTMPTSEIKAGMKGYGLSVFRGTIPERFDVEVIDVLHNFRPDQDLVLIRTPHPLLDHAGSVAGMSGSPVYLEGKLIGAYAYGWSFGKDPIAGVTPIANMLKELERPVRPHAFPVAAPLPEPRVEHSAPKPRAAFVGQERRDAFWALSHHTARAAQNQGSLVPVATPLLVGGMVPAVARMLGERFAPLGLEVLEAGGGSAHNAQTGPNEYVDGGSIAVTLLRGDVVATAVGTVTYVDGKRAVAFGHPMLDAGEVGLPTATSRVLHIMASERSSFKIAEALRPLGALVHDRQSAIVIDNDVRPSTIPVSIRIRGLKGIPRDVWNVESVSHRMLTPGLVLSALGNALGASVNDADDMMFRAESVVTIKGHGAQRVVDEGFSALGVSQVSALARLRLFDLLEAAYANPFERTEIERIEVTLDVRFGREVTEIVGAQLQSEQVNPGEPARVTLSLRPYAGPVEQRVIEVPLPASLAGETVDIELLPGDDARLEQPVPANLEDVLSIVRSGLPSTSLVVSVQRRARGLSLSGQVVRDLPSSALDTLAPAHDTTPAKAFVSQERTTYPMGRVMQGQAKLTLEVRKEKR